MTEWIDISLNSLTGDVHSALRNYFSVNEETDSLLAELVLVQEQRNQMSNVSATSLRHATNKVLLDGIHELKRRDEFASSLLYLRFLEKETLKEVDQRLKIYNFEKVKRLQKQAISQLAGVIHEQEVQVRENKITQLENGLEAKTYSQLFGIEEKAEKLELDLQNFEQGGVITLTGIGGIGKTSLANHVVRKIIRSFSYKNIIWLSVPRRYNKNPLSSPEQVFNQLVYQMCVKLLPALSSSLKPEKQQESLRHLLKGAPYLIIVDNLELQSDTSYLLSNLLELAYPSKFLLTSRYQHSSHSGVKAYVLNELSKEHTIELIRAYATEVHLPELAEADEERLMPIFDTVGGNPFAIKLLVSLANVRPIPEILDDLRKAHSKEIDALYNKIFMQAWNSISDSAKQLLTVMPLSAQSGMPPDQILTISQLRKEELWPAINELVGRSLLEVRGTAWNRRYGIHRLTDTFINNEILM